MILPAFNTRMTRAPAPLKLSKLPRELVIYFLGKCFQLCLKVKG